MATVDRDGDYSDEGGGVWGGRGFSAFMHMALPPLLKPVQAGEG